MAVLCVEISTHDYLAGVFDTLMPPEIMNGNAEGSVGQAMLLGRGRWGCGSGGGRGRGGELRESRGTELIELPNTPLLASVCLLRC